MYFYPDPADLGGLLERNTAVGCSQLVIHR